MRRLLAAVRDLYTRAYGWDPQVDLDRFFETSERDRLCTRSTVLEYLDLMYLYREKPVARAGTHEEMILEEVTSEEDEQ